MSEAAIIDGKAFAARLREATGNRIARLRERTGVQPGLAVVLVGEDPASQTYVRTKAEKTQELGMISFVHRLSAETSQDELVDLVARLNADPAVHGILVQLPLPGHIAESAVLAEIDPDKDVDGFHVVNAGRLLRGEPGIVPCTPLGCLAMLKDQLGELNGLRAVVVGRSNLVGKPMAQLLLAENATVTIAHSRTRELAEECRRADILVAAVGRPRMITGDWIQPGATVIDVGINRIDAPEKGPGKTRLVGDVDFESAKAVAGAITPVPGGVGPMTVAILLENALTAACRQLDVDPKSLS